MNPNMRNCEAYHGMCLQSFEGALCSLDATTDPTREAARSSSKVTPPPSWHRLTHSLRKRKYGSPLHILSVLAQMCDITHSLALLVLALGLGAGTIEGLQWSTQPWGARYK